jgi:hypothetical protein
MIDSEFKLIYDRKTNYFSSVIITKNISYDNDFWGAYLNENNIIVPLKEAYKSTFFRLEYFIRNFIISNFKNHIVFWDFNKPVIRVLQQIMTELEEKNTRNIADHILGLINYIAQNCTS